MDQAAARRQKWTDAGTKTDTAAGVPAPPPSAYARQ
jgi:hypothetical protein